MKRLAILALCTLGTLTAARAEGPDAAAFRAPPAADRPETWFHFIGGNVSEAGIDLDLDAISSAGLSGIQLFHGQFGGPWPGAAAQIKCLSPSWDGLVASLAAKARARGLRFSMENCPGWATAGGPWIAPSNAMRRLVASRTDAEGGRALALRLPRPGGDEPWRDYRDIAVLAFPAPLGDDPEPVPYTSVASSLPGNPAADWLRGKTVSLPASAGKPVTLDFAFAKPVTLRTLVWPCVQAMSHAWCYDPRATLRAEALGPGGPAPLLELALPQSDWQDREPLTLALPDSHAPAADYRLTLACEHAVRLAPPRFLTAARHANWEAESARTLRALLPGPAPAQDPAAWLAPAAVTNLTPLLAPDGTLTWAAPAGRWVILRLGHVNTGRKNSPAPPEATGWECDKLSPAGADAHYAGYIGRLAGARGPLRGKLDTMLLDSWECETQTWTPGLDATFRASLGYDLAPFLPALLGWTVRDPETTSRFLDDWRALLSRLITENFYGRMAAHARADGLAAQFETSFGDVLPGDILEYYKHADIPMCEFWEPRGDCFVGSPDFKPVRPCVSAARLYGKRRVAAEAFTEMSAAWTERLRYLAYVANLHLAQGVTHLAFHTYTHNPLTNALPPGPTFGEAGIGTPFLRSQTWWFAMPEFTACLGRCQRLLETGRPVTDILWYLGDECDHKPPETAPLPAGFHADYCNPDILLRRLRVDGGLWSTPEGLTYRLLWAPSARRLRPETIERLLALARRGGRIALAAAPEAPATLSGGAAAARRFEAARRALLADPRVTVGKPLAQILAGLRLAPDLEAEGLLWQHRLAGSRHLYFLAPATEAGYRGAPRFRDMPRPEIWDPVSGEILPAPADGILDIPAGRALFVVSGSALAPRAARPRAEQTVGPWHLSYPGAELDLAALAPWQDLPVGPEAKAYSGTAAYTAAFTLASTNAPVTLNLGRVESVAAVTLNGRRLRTLWCEPYRLDITAAARPGSNLLSVAVADTWHNRLAYDAALPEPRRKTWTYKGPGPGSPLQPSGLLGPVTLTLQQ